MASSASELESASESEIDAETEADAETETDERASFLARPAPINMRSRIPRASRVEEDSIACDQVADGISEYLDGELEPAVARTIAVHLSRCPACARVAAELALTVAALHRLSPAPGVTLGWLAGSFHCGAERRPAAPRFPAVHSFPGDAS